VTFSIAQADQGSSRAPINLIGATAL